MPNPKGNISNLTPFSKDDNRASLAGKKSGKVRAERAIGKLLEKVVDGDKTVLDAMNEKLVRMVIEKGDVAAYMALMGYRYGRPTQQIEEQVEKEIKVYIHPAMKDA